MVIITEDNKIVYKILFWGCSSSGKNTSLDTLSRLCTEQEINVTHKSDLINIEKDSQVFIDRGVFYSKRWFNSGFHCYIATPNNPDINLPKDLFNETDGVIFVVDSQRSRLNDNIDSLKESECTYLSS